MNIRHLAFGLSVGLLLAPAVAHAQLRRLTRDERRTVDALYARAESLLPPAGQPVAPEVAVEAGQLYLTIYGITGDCQLLFNAGTAFERAMALETAASQYRVYLASAPGTCESLQRLDGGNAARERLAAIDRLLHPPVIAPAPHPPVSALAPPPPFPSTVPRRVLVPTRPMPHGLTRVAIYGGWIGGGAVGAFGLYSLVFALRDSSRAGEPGPDQSTYSSAARSAWIATGFSLAIAGAAITYATILYRRRPTVNVPVLIAPTVSGNAFVLSATLSL